MLIKCAILLLFSAFFLSFCILYSTAEYAQKPKSILTVLLARNKQHTLPYSLTLFSQLNYPKERISLFIRSDHNLDQTPAVLREWLSVHQDSYHSVDMSFNETPFQYDHEGSPTNWTDERFDHVIALKDEALLKARKMWADYVLFLDSDVFLVEPNVLWDLVKEKKPIVAPMLNSLGTYSNYWCGMTSNYWYERTEEYIPILNRKKEGCFLVPMIHSCILIDMSLSAADKLSYNSEKIPNYNGPKDDIISMAVGAKDFGMDMYVCNNQIYGYIPSPLAAEEPLSKDYQYLRDIKLEALVHFPPFQILDELKKYAIPFPPKKKLNFDNIYLINLVRRPDRRERMLWSFDELGIEAEIFDAVDGKRMNVSYLEDLGVKQLDNYKDPWSKRDMTYGEIGCFLSHYYLWEDIVKNGYKEVLVFEDDIRFEPFFTNKLSYMMDQISQLNLKWDFIYLGRKQLKSSEEPWVRLYK
ncbi:UNVERIFIED_CONTAM: hypothetical protein GTU68_016328 [Idotea baltica]|nr:hypothetical protein [Idotea baltica]